MSWQEEYADRFLHSDSENRADVLVDAAKDFRLAEQDYIMMLIENWNSCDGIHPEQARVMWKTRTLPCPLFGNNYARRRFRRECNVESLVVYRGQIEGRLNFSWTLNFDKAAWFAFRYPYGPKALLLAQRDGSGYPNTELLMAKVRPENVLGFFTSRREAEIVVDYEDLQDIEVHPLTPYFRPMNRKTF
jgi:hypothetical protein